MVIIDGMHCKTKFNKLCFIGTPSNVLQTCPAGTVCTTAATVCQLSTIAAPACVTDQTEAGGFCNVCSADQRFACINATAFSFCFGLTVPSTYAIQSCPSGQVCDILADAPNFCSSNLAVIVFSCKIFLMQKWQKKCLQSVSCALITSIPGTSSNATILCNRQGIAGRFPVVRDSTCQQ